MGMAVTALFKAIGRPSKNTRTTESEFGFSLEPGDQYPVCTVVHTIPLFIDISKWKRGRSLFECH